MCVAVSCHRDLEGEGVYGDGRIVMSLYCCEVDEGETGGTLLLLM